MQEEQRLDTSIRRLGSEQTHKINLIETQIALTKTIKELTGNVGKQKERLELKLTTTKENLGKAKGNLSNLQAKRLEIQSKLTSISVEIQKNKVNVNERKTALAASKTELLDLKEQLAVLQDDFQAMKIMLKSPHQPVLTPAKKESRKDLIRLLKDSKAAEQVAKERIDLLQAELTAVSRSIKLIDEPEPPVFNEAETNEIEELTQELERYLLDNEKMRLELRNRGEIGRHYAEYMSSRAAK